MRSEVSKKRLCSEDLGCHAPLFVRILRHISPTRRRLIIVLAVRACNRRRTMSTRANNDSNLSQPDNRDDSLLFHET